MKKLILMRHAEAQPIHLSSVDWDRPLALEGLQQLERIRNGIQQSAGDISLVLCSNARRTRQTFEAIRNILPGKCQYQFTDTLYKATAESIVQAVQDVENTHKSVLVIGHNPSLSHFLQFVLECNPAPKNGQKVEQKERDVSPATLVFFKGYFEKWVETAFTKLHLDSILRGQP